MYICIYIYYIYICIYIYIWQNNGCNKYISYISQTSGNNIQEGITSSTQKVTMHATEDTEIQPPSAVKNRCGDAYSSFSFQTVRVTNKMDILPIEYMKHFDAIEYTRATDQRLVQIRELTKQDS